MRPRLAPAGLIRPLPPSFPGLKIVACKGVLVRVRPGAPIDSMICGMSSPLRREARTRVLPYSTFSQIANAEVLVDFQFERMPGICYAVIAAFDSIEARDGYAHGSQSE